MKSKFYLTIAVLESVLGVAFLIKSDFSFFFAIVCFALALIIILKELR